MTMPPPKQKQRYRYRLRTLADPPKYYSLEAGPFTPQQAIGFGQNEAINRTTVTGTTWVCDYEPIVEAEAERSPSWLPLFFIAGVFIAIVVGLGVAAHLLKQRADDTCRARAREGVTLCRGEVYAMNVLGEIECACGPQP